MALAMLVAGGAHIAPASGTDAPWNVAQNAGLTADIDRLHARYDSAPMPGAIIAVLRRGEILHLEGYGLANREFGIPWTPQTLYTFYSTTKSMTCLALLALADQGKLSLDDDIRGHLTDFPQLDRTVTIRHLMNHTSGLWQDETLLHLAGVSAAYAPLTLQELYELNKKQRHLPYAPGSNYYYNDAGTRLAARIIEKVSGLDFGAALRALVFDPAGMRTARAASDVSLYPGQASSYLLGATPGADPASAALSTGPSVVQSSGDGAGVGAMQDFIAYALYLTTPLSGGSRRIDRLTPAAQTTPWHVSPYRYGMVEQTHRGLRVIYHGGLYGKLIVYLPQLDVWVLMMRNALDYDVASNNDRMTAIIDAVLRNLDDGADYLSVNNPDRDAVLGVPRDPRWSPAELAAFDGTFVEPRSGFVVRLKATTGHAVPQLQYSFQGIAGVLARDNGGLATYPARNAMNAIRLSQSSSGIGLQYADWPSPRPLQRVVEMGTFPAAERAALAGRYRNDELDVLYEIAQVPGDATALELHINGGNRESERFAMHAVTPDVFEAKPRSAATYLDLAMTARIERRAGVPVGFVITTVDVKDLRFRKVRIVDAGGR
jgi:CubicO group peptidase (beta-lactamase class C family)